MGAGDGGGAGVQRLPVESVRPPKGLAELEGAGGRAGEEAVAVAAGGGVAAGVEAIGDDVGGGDGDIVGCKSIQAARQVTWWVDRGLEARHLSQRVDAGVGAAG